MTIAEDAIQNRAPGANPPGRRTKVYLRGSAYASPNGRNAGATTGERCELAESAYPDHRGYSIRPNHFPVAVRANRAGADRDLGPGGALFSAFRIEGGHRKVNGLERGGVAFRASCPATAGRVARIQFAA